ncbi:MAG: hypothetical protein QM788_05475 [Roseateles sp.]|uniref:hypothetical protein n=1 Tax=Roseateles sp. TaxID=1971397 RepID=UPI0039EBEE84
MTKPGIHRRWNLRFLLSEISCRVPEQAGLSPDRLAESLLGHKRREDKIASYADGDPDTELVDVLLPMHWHAQQLIRRAEYDIYKHGNPDRSALLVGVWNEAVRALLHFGRGVAVLNSSPCWWSSIRDISETISMVYSLGWNAVGDKISQCALQVMPHGALWSDEDFDPRWEKRREPFARFVLDLYADFAGVTLPTMPPHPYESPPYDSLLTCWRNPEPINLMEPLLAACDWHTHECMYSRSDRPSKNVDFINDTLMGWPVEVHMVYRLRERLNLALPEKLDHPLMQVPLGPYLPPQPIPHDERLDRIIRRACSEVPGLQEVLQGAV